MNYYFVALNGPPKTGKDEIANYLAFGSVCSSDTLFIPVQFKWKLNQLVKVIFSLSDEEWDRMTEREQKELPQERLGGLSSRQALIKVSEEIIKPAMGEEYFGWALANRITEYITEIPTRYSETEIRNVCFVSSDSGFISEIRPIIKLVGAENLLFVRLHRDGYTFQGDSRTYLYPERDNPHVTACDIDNIEGDLAGTFKKVENTIKNFIGAHK